MPEYTHVAYTDESHWNDGRYRAVAMVSMRREHHARVESESKQLLIASNISEFKWKEFRGAKERFGAGKLAVLSLDAALRGMVRVDVVCWDIEDERHRVTGRDDVANLHRMYFHLLRVVLRDRWPDSAIWAVRPDEHTGLDWSVIGEHLHRASVLAGAQEDMYVEGGLNIFVRRAFRIVEIAPVHSVDSPLTQIADLYAGLACFSRTKYDDFLAWRGRREAVESLVPDISPEGAESRAERERFAFLEEFNGHCKHRKLGVSLKTHRGLRTPQPRNPINFWWYEPQHDQDRAPVRARA